MDSENISQNQKILSAVSYLVVGILIYFISEELQKDNFFKFHVKQSIVLLMVDIIVVVIVPILSFILAWVPFINILFLIVDIILDLVIFVFILIGIYNSVNGKMAALPVIGEYSRYINI